MPVMVGTMHKIRRVAVQLNMFIFEVEVNNWKYTHCKFIFRPSYKTDTTLCRRISSKKSSSPGIQEQTLVVLIPLQIVSERLSPFPTLR